MKYFAYILLFMLALSLMLLLGFDLLLSGDAVYPADRGQQQAAAAADSIREAESVTPALIPELCRYALFDGDGVYLSGDLGQSAAKKGWESVRGGATHSGGSYYTLIDCRQGYCLLQYRLTPQYASPLLRALLLPPQTLMAVLAALGLLLAVVLLALRFGRALNEKLTLLVAAVNRVERQELDFAAAESGVREIDSILAAMDSMRCALKDSLARQWALEQERTRQLSSLAHDLKTPLTVVRGNAELLLETPLSAEQNRYAEFVEDSALRMQRYVQRLIELSGSGESSRFHAEPTDCAWLLEQLRRQCEGLCAARGSALNWRCTQVHGHIAADRELLLRAFMNVASNAAEHTPSGGSVTVSAASGDGLFTLTVRDSGSGFTDSALRHAAEQFYMDDASRGSGEHFGIGLYTADTVLRRHGGRLLLDNAPDGGARVTMTLPLLDEK